MSPVIESSEGLMEGSEKVAGRGRIGHSVDEVRAHRSASRSSTSSDILVAPGPRTASAQPSLYELPLPWSPTTIMARSKVDLDVRQGRLLVFKARNEPARDFLKRLQDDVQIKTEGETHVTKRPVKIKTEVNEDDEEGPNARGTYSKQYTLLHPEIEWVHRGQGRWLPVSHSRKPSLSRLGSQTKLTDTGSSKTPTDFKSKSRSSIVPSRRRSLDDDSKTSIFATPIQRLSLRRQVTEGQGLPTIDQRSSRFSRRAKPVLTTEFERRSSRFSTQHNYNEDDEDYDMAGDGELTYDKDHVDAHPNEKFYHTGNGWYKKGDRPKTRKMAKNRENEGHATVRRRDGSFQFDGETTIHGSQLGNYPGIEFHHCGNGWFKPGPDGTGHRISRVVGDEYGDEDDEDEDDAEGMNEDEDVSVSKSYALAHPETEWVHRGNGRYKRKSAVSGPATQASESTSPAVEHDKLIYPKAYVMAHPEQEWHHRGNARYMKGPAPEHSTASRKKSDAATIAAEEEDETLYSKAYKNQHPELEFHHRGQGRYKRGPRVKPEQAEDEEDQEQEESDTNPDALVTTAYVNNHPNGTFHHRGQGRWARGLPPVGASKKMAVRGPGASKKLDAADLIASEDPQTKVPGKSALLRKEEGPNLWPGFEWHYRGGGKWSRITKQEFEDIQRGNSRKQKGKGRARNANGPEAQLEREAAAAEAARRASEEYGFDIAGEMDVDGLAVEEKPKIKRRRMNKRGSFQTQAQDEGLVSKQSSQSQSLAPTPKPRMLEPEEDILTEEDLPQLYQDDWSPATEDIDDYGAYMPNNLFRAMTSTDKFVKALTKHDPAVRSLDNLKALAENTQRALEGLQNEYLFLERITAPHARIPRKPAKGGRIPVDQQIFEDKKEADLYDYSYDPRRIGYQDPEAQKIQRDADGRELRNRRNRNATANNGTLPGWNFGEDEPLGPRRAVKPVNRFDGIVDQPRSRRGRNSATATGRTSKAPSMTPDRTTTPLGGPAMAAGGRWRGHVPKRIRELRDESVGGASKGREASPGSIRKGRPPGSKNLHKRRDAGIKKGPRKPKGVGSTESPFGSEGEEQD